jgi:hypothetical protein
MISWTFLTPTASPPKSIKPKANANPSGKPNADYRPLSIDMFDDLELKPSQEDIDYFNLFPFDRLDKNDSWISVGFIVLLYV